MNHTLIKTLVVAGLLVVPTLYFLYQGGKAFSRELNDFNPTPHNANRKSHEKYLAMTKIARKISWKLKDNGLQRGFYIPSQNGALIVYAHGSPGAATSFVPEMEAMAEAGFGGLAVDLPGYGDSEGKRDWGDSYIESIVAAVDFAIRQPGVDAGRIGGFGYSMGACIIARAAASDSRLGAFVLLAGYTNLYDQLHHQFQRRVPGIGFFAIAAAMKSGVKVMQMDTQSALTGIDARPVFVISGTDDSIIPTDMAVKLAETAPNSDIWLVSGAGHANVSKRAGSEYFDRIRSFFNKALRLDDSALHRPAQSLTN